MKVSLCSDVVRGAYMYIYTVYVSIYIYEFYFIFRVRMYVYNVYIFLYIFTCSIYTPLCLLIFALKAGGPHRPGSIDDFPW